MDAEEIIQNTSLVKRQLPEPTQNKLAKYGLDIQVGDLVMDLSHGNSQGDIRRVGKITKRKIYLQRKYDGEWHNSSRVTYTEFQNRPYTKMEMPLEELTVWATQQVLNLDALEEEAPISEETALAKVGNKEALLRMEQGLQAKKRQFELIQAVMARKMNALSCIARGLRDQLEKVHKVLDVVELYLGVHEKIYQIRQGNPASPTTPISIRQQLLYMDEEFGDPRDGGLDSYMLKDFDAWIAEPDNLYRFLPEEKGIVALKVRRRDKKYHGTAFENAILNQGNHKTYLLIRNGDNLYRIWSNVNVHPRLFPTKKEFEPRIKRWMDGTEHKSPFDDERIEKASFEYKKYGLMIQGIMHRTEIFQPMEVQIDIFKPDTWGDMIQLIRDDEAMLPTGRLPWREWQKEINSKIQVGSRIIYTRLNNVDMAERTDYHYGKWTNAPETGSYVVETGINGETGPGEFRFFYNPGDQVYGDYWETSHTRKKRIGFRFWFDEVLNYDQLSLDDLEYYINSRTDRGNYLDMLPLLYELRDQRKAELEHEKHFVKLVRNRTGASEEQIWKAVEWWKFKNKWKRPIAEDDAKALRMIERRLK
jgi:hypothetical protein